MIGLNQGESMFVVGSNSIKLYWHDIKTFYILPKRFKFSLVQITLIV